MLPQASEEYDVADETEDCASRDGGWDADEIDYSQYRQNDDRQNGSRDAVGEKSPNSQKEHADTESGEPCRYRRVQSRRVQEMLEFLLSD